MKAPENCVNLPEGFSDVLDNPKLNIVGEIYTVAFYLCCDYKVNL